MNIPKPDQSPSHPLHHLIHKTFNSLQAHVSNVFPNLQPPKFPFFASISNQNSSAQVDLGRRSTFGSATKRRGMSPEAIDERLAGVPVYALSNASQEFVLVSGTNTGKSLGLFCFSESDAEALLKQMKSVDPSMSFGSQVVPVALSKVCQLKVDGVALRLIPEASQIKNALKESQKDGVSVDSFPGVPVFQSKSLILSSQNKSYRPVFFRKEDLEKSLSRASHDQRQLNPGLRQGDIQVAVLEDIIQGMKDDSVSSWDDVVFVPPGFDVSTNPYRRN